MKGWIVTALAHGVLLFYCLTPGPRVHPDPRPAPRTVLILLPAQAARKSVPAAAAIVTLRPQRAISTRVAHMPPAPAPAVAAVPPPDGTMSTEPAATEPAAPVFDMAAARQSARAIAREPAGGAGHAVSATVDDKLGRAIDGARRRDCRTEYAGLGLLAIAPLLIDGVSGSGCKFR